MNLMVSGNWSFPPKLPVTFCTKVSSRYRLFFSNHLYVLEILKKVAGKLKGAVQSESEWAPHVSCPRIPWCQCHSAFRNKRLIMRNWHARCICALYRCRIAFIRVLTSRSLQFHTIIVTYILTVRFGYVTSTNQCQLPRESNQHSKSFLWKATKPHYLKKLIVLTFFANILWFWFISSWKLILFSIFWLTL